MPEAPVSIVLVGIGGMGSVYVEELLKNSDDRLCRIAGAVDPVPERCPQLAELRDMGIPLFPSLEDFYKNHTAELAVISSPIPFHRLQTCLALSAGSYVLCEKPVAATIQEAREMREAEIGSSRWVAIGYQWSYSSSVQALKKDILSGLLGKAGRLKCLYFWPRDEAYYGRNDWAGKKRDSAGAWILDSPAGNAMAHDLHNMFYVLGGSIPTSARPAEVEAELYRANPIENFDTAAVRCWTDEGVEILFYVTHASLDEKGPVFLYEFTNAAVLCKSRTSGIWAKFDDGTVKNYGVPDDEPLNKLWEAIRNVRSGGQPLLGIEGASSHTLCLNGVQDSMPEIRAFPEALLHTKEEGHSRRVWVEGLEDVLESCYADNVLPSEKEVFWSAKGRLISLGPEYVFPHE